MEKFKTGEIVRSICKELGLTNKQVADIISMTPQNVSRLFHASNLNTDTIDRLTQGLGINIYAALAKKWDEYSDVELSDAPDLEREFTKVESKIDTGMKRGKPRISILIELDNDKQDEVLRILDLKKTAT